MKFSEFVKLPAVIVSTCVAVVAIAATITKYVSVPDDFRAHLSSSAQVHDSMSRTDKDIHQHLESLERLARSMHEERSVEQCMENDYVMLAKQKLLRICDSLGIERHPNDVPPQ